MLVSGCGFCCCGLLVCFFLLGAPQEVPWRAVLCGEGREASGCSVGTQQSLVKGELTPTSVFFLLHIACTPSALFYFPVVLTPVRAGHMQHLAGIWKRLDSRTRLRYGYVSERQRASEARADEDVPDPPAPPLAALSGHPMIGRSLSCDHIFSWHEHVTRGTDGSMHAPRRATVTRSDGQQPNESVVHGVVKGSTVVSLPDLQLSANQRAEQRLRQQQQSLKSAQRPVSSIAVDLAPKVDNTQDTSPTPDAPIVVAIPSPTVPQPSARARSMGRRTGTRTGTTRRSRRRNHINAMLRRMSQAGIKRGSRRRATGMPGLPYTQSLPSVVLKRLGVPRRRRKKEAAVPDTSSTSGVSGGGGGGGGGTGGDHPLGSARQPHPPRARRHAGSSDSPRRVNLRRSLSTSDAPAQPAAPSDMPTDNVA